MDSTRKLDIIGELGKLSPKEKIFEQLESKKILENVIGFIPACDSADVPILVSNLGVYLGEMGYSICILDANVFYPCIYKLFGCESKPRGRGLLSVLRSDKMDFRDEIIKTKYKNVYLMSSSFMDLLKIIWIYGSRILRGFCLRLRTCLIWFWFPYRIIRRLSPVMYR